MPVTSEASPVEYAGNNSTVTGYVVPWLFWERAHLTVLVDGVEITAFTVDGEGSGSGNVYTDSAVGSGSTVRIEPGHPATQPTTLYEGMSTPQTLIEKATNWLSMGLQTVKRSIGITTYPGEDSLELPKIATRANKALAFDASGNPTTAEVLTASEKADLAGITAGATGNNGIKYFDDAADRATTTPDRAGQRGIQLDDKSEWHADSTTTGDWSLAPSATNTAQVATIKARMGARQVNPFNPTITRTLIIDGRTGGNTASLDYMHDHSFIDFDGEYFSAFNANTVAAEGDPGQKIYVMQSATLAGLAAADINDELRDATYSSNPITDDANRLGWQPILMRKPDNSELWMLSSILSGKDDATAPTWGRRAGNATVFSKKTSAAGTWTNYYLEFDANNDVSLDSGVTSAPSGTERLWAHESKTWALFPTNSAATHPRTGDQWVGTVAIEVDATGWAGGNYVIDDAVLRKMVFLVISPEGDIRIEGPYEITQTEQLTEHWVWEPFCWWDDQDRLRVGCRYPHTAASSSIDGPLSLLVYREESPRDGLTPTMLSTTVTRNATIAHPLNGRLWFSGNDNPQESIQTQDNVTARQNLALGMIVDGKEPQFGNSLHPTDPSTYEYYPAFTWSEDGDTLFIAATQNDGPTWNGDKSMIVYSVTGFNSWSKDDRLGMPRDNGLNFAVDSSATVSGNDFVVTGQSSVSVETKGDGWRIIFTASVDAEPDTSKDVYLAAVGDVLASASLILRKTVSGLRLILRDEYASGNYAVNGAREQDLGAASLADTYSVSYKAGRASFKSNSTGGQTTLALRSLAMLGRGIIGDVDQSAVSVPDVTTTFSDVYVEDGTGDPWEHDWAASWYLGGSDSQAEAGGGQIRRWDAFHDLRRQLRDMNGWQYLKRTFFYVNGASGGQGKLADFKDFGTKGSFGGSIVQNRQGYIESTASVHLLDTDYDSMGLAVADCAVLVAVTENYQASGTNNRLLIGNMNSGTPVGFEFFVDNTADTFTVRAGASPNHEWTGVSIADADQRGVWLVKRLGTNTRAIRVTSAGITAWSTSSITDTTAFPTGAGSDAYPWVLGRHWENGSNNIYSTSKTAASSYMTAMSDDLQDSIAQAFYDCLVKAGVRLP